MICLYLKIPVKFLCLVLQDEIWFVYISFVSMVKLKFFAQFPMDHLPYLVLYTFCASLLFLLIMWLIVSSLSLHTLHLLPCHVFSIFAWTLLVLIVLFCAALRRDSVSFLNFSFRSHVQVFSCKISLVCFFKYPCVFFSFLFLSCCCFVDLYVFCAVYGRCNYYYFFLLWEFFTSAFAEW